MTAPTLPLRSVLREVRRAPERLVHGWRRRAALRRLAEGPTPHVILVVCHGNICRSPYAAARLRSLRPELRETVRIVSGGLVLPGRSCPAAAVEVAAARGLDLSGHRSRLLGPSDVYAADVIVVMDGIQQWTIRALYGRHVRDVVMLGDLDPEAIETRAIVDPFERPKEVFERCYSRIDRCVSALVQAVAAGPRAERSSGMPPSRAEIAT